jgi:hypothetical protein
MFNWFQHLFTLRVIQRENSNLIKQVADLQSQIDINAKVIAVKDEEIRRIKDEFEAFKKFHNSKPLNYPSSGGGPNSWMGN